MKTSRFGHSILQILLAYMIAGGSGHLAAQTAPLLSIEKYPFEYITSAHHPPGSTVLSVFQDSKGFIWFGGGNPEVLTRYDGVETIVHELPDPDESLPMRVWRIIEDGLGNLVLGTNYGVFFYDPDERAYRRVTCPGSGRQVINDLLSDPDGPLWAASEFGLFRIDADGSNCRRIPVEATSAETDTDSTDVRALVRDDEGVLWLASSRGLIRFDERTGESSTFVVPHDAENPWLGAIVIDADEQIWTAGRNRICRFDKRNNVGSCMPVEASIPSQNIDQIRKIVPAEDGTLWLALRELPSPFGSAGLVNYDPVTEEVRRFPYAPANDRAFIGTQVHDLMRDRSGAFWLGINFYGAARMDPGLVRFMTFEYDPERASSLSHNVVWSVRTGPDSTLWFGTDNGLDVLDRRTGLFERLRYDPSDPTGLSNPQVKTIYFGQNDRVWIGTWGGGLILTDPARSSFQYFRHDPENPASISSDGVESLHEDSMGILWIGTMRGLDRLDTPGGQSVRVLSGYRIIYDIHEDPGADIWVGSYSALLHYDRETDAFTDYPMEPVTGITDAEGGNLWIISGNRLILFDRKSRDFTDVTDRDGLPEGRYWSVTNDGNGHLWLATSRNGLVRYSPRTGRHILFDERDGLPSVNYWRMDLNRSPTGEILSGTRNGAVLFDPSKIEENPFLPPVVVTAILPDGAPVLRPALKEPNRTRIQLAPDQVDFTISYAALNYRNSADNRYSYRLLGYDASWSDTTYARQARYTSMAPGQYVFEVRGSNDDGIWSEQTARVEFEIMPPWWATNAARLLYVLFGVGSILLLFKIQRTHLLRREREKATIRENALKIEAAEMRADTLRSLDEAKSRFFVNVSHELRTPLTLLLGPTQDLLDGTFGAISEELRPHIQTMKRNGERLHELIEQLLDIARLDAGRMEINPVSTELVSFFRGIVRDFAPLAEFRSISLTFQSGREEIRSAIDRDVLHKVLSNLVHNAIKFTPSGGVVRVNVRATTAHEHPSVEVSVRDSGPGIPADEVPHIFERFHRVSGGAEAVGTGIGLSLVHDLVRLHGGTTHVRTELGYGSEFVFSIPLEQSATTHGSDGIRETVTRPLDKQSDPQIQIASDRPLVLIVEDHADVRTYIRNILEPDYRVLEADDGLRGLEDCRQHVPDLIICDVMMPGMDGFELCRHIREDANTAHIPLVLLTARAEEQSRIHGLETGADDYITKPFSSATLIARIENLIEIRRQLRSHYSDHITVGPARVEVESADASFLTSVIDVIEARIGDPNLSPEDLADSTAVSRRQLDRKLKALTDLSAAGLIRKMRLERAAQLLESDAGNVSQIAYDIGFRDPKYFSRLFNQAFGIAPSNFAGAEDD